MTNELIYGILGAGVGGAAVYFLIKQNIIPSPVVARARAPVINRSVARPVAATNQISKFGRTQYNGLVISKSPITKFPNLVRVD